MQDSRPNRHRVNIFSGDKGHTYTTIGLGTLMIREDVEKAVIGAAEVVGVDPENFIVLGSTTCNSTGEVALGVVGINFRASLPVDTAAVFALHLTIDRGDVIINLGRIGEADSLTPIPFLNPGQ